MFLLDALPRRAWFALLAVGGFGLVVVGLVIQDVYRVNPCPLCIFQRLLYGVIGLVALFGLMAPALPRLWAALLAVISLGGFATAAYQTWMQAYPHLAPECSFTDPNMIERLVDWLGMQWPSLFMATGFCTSRDWEFLTLSIANWSAVAFAGFAAASLFLLARAKKLR